MVVCYVEAFVSVENAGEYAVRVCRRLSGLVTIAGQKSGQWHDEAGGVDATITTCSKVSGLAQVRCSASEVNHGYA